MGRKGDAGARGEIGRGKRRHGGAVGAQSAHGIVETGVRTATTSAAAAAISVRSAASHGILMNAAVKKEGGVFENG